MQCPACPQELSHLLAADKLYLDVCDKGCGGVWFDNHELQKIDEAHELKDSPVFAITPVKPVKGTVGTEAPKRVCPRCEGQKMRRYFFSVKRQIEVDECPNCGGDWLDNEELQKIRGEYIDAQAREADAVTKFGEMFDDELAEMRKVSEANVARAQKFARLFKVICPSAYIPGKQDWGAF